MSYEVFARKYRPKTFADVIGQEHIVRTLTNAIRQNRLAHAYIFVGPRGTGKTSTARILAKALNCTDGPKVEFDPDEDICREIAEGRSMNVLEFDAASNTGVDKIRDLIIDNVKYAPTRGKYKVYIVDEVHMLSTSSFNALLKTLEEPPSHVIFVFATTDVQKVPTTILSRCQRFDLKRIPTPLIRDHLLYIAGNEKLSLSEAAAETIARGAEGGMRDAESMLDQLVAFCGDNIEEPDVLRVFGFTAQQTVAALCDCLLAGDASGALGIVHTEAEAGRDLTRLLSDLIAYLRSLLVVKADPQALDLEFNPDAVAAARAQAEQIDLSRLLDLLERCAEAEQRMKWAPNKKMHLEIAVIRAIQTLNQATLTEVLDTLSAMRDGTPPPAAPTRTIPQVTRTPAAPAKPAAPVTPRVVAPSPAPTPKPVAAPAPAPVIPKAAESPPKPVAAPAPEPPVPIPVAAVTPATPSEVKTPDPAPVSAVADLSGVWTAVIQRVRRERPLIAGNVERTVLLELKEDSALVGLDSADALGFELLEAPNTRKFIDTLVAEFAGRPVTVKFVKRDGLVVTPPPREPEPVAPPKLDPMTEFKNDPLIRRALDLFKAEIQPA